MHIIPSQKWRQQLKDPTNKIFSFPFFAGALLPDLLTVALYYFQNVDLTKHRLIYDGLLSMKLGDTRRFKNVELHVLLLEDCIMLLQKQDDKFLLKFHTGGGGGVGQGQGNSGKFCHSPVIKFSTMLVRPVATGKWFIN